MHTIRKHSRMKTVNTVLAALLALTLTACGTPSAAPAETPDITPSAEADVMPSEQPEASASPEPAEEPSPEPSAEPETEIPEITEEWVESLTSDDEKLVYKSKSARFIFYYDENGNITRFLTYSDRGTPEEAQKALEEALSSNPEEQKTDSEPFNYHTAGKYLGFEYGEKDRAQLSVESVRETYGMLEEVLPE